ncbi:MAG: glycosyltransferase family 2 protein [Porphyrobacter sp.]|nr:glycosyltransferase family 2 protein [Porphyrobacter sp.]
MTDAAPHRRKFSAIIPTHLRADLLSEAISSVASQSLPPSELIVVSDVDDADTRELMAARERTLPFPLRYHVNDTQPGACGSRNQGAQLALGDWLAFLDDDDVWCPDFLLRCAETADRKGSTLILATLIERSPEREDCIRSFPEGLDRYSFFSFPGGMTGSNFTIARERFLGVGGFDPQVTVFNDWDLLFRLIAADPDYAVIGEPLVEWRQHEGERIGSRSQRRAQGLDFFVDRYTQYMPPELIAELRATAASIRRDLSESWAGYVEHSLAIAKVRGVSGVLKKLGVARS